MDWYKRHNYIKGFIFQNHIPVVKSELSLSNYATKSDLKKSTVVDISDFAKKSYLASLKSTVDWLDIGKSCCSK